MFKPTHPPLSLLLTSVKFKSNMWQPATMASALKMGFTWIHLNQINVGTNVAVGCASYRRRCTLTGVSTCATVNTCTKHKKRCSKGKPLYVYSTHTKDKKHCSEEGSRCREQKHVDQNGTTATGGRSTQRYPSMSRFVSFTTQTRSTRKRGSSTRKQRF